MIAFGEAGTGPEAVKLARQQPWDVAVVDLSLGDASGLEVLKELKQARPKLPIMILSKHSEEQYARRSFKDCAAGYITKDSPRANWSRPSTASSKAGDTSAPHSLKSWPLTWNRGPDIRPTSFSRIGSMR